MVLARFFKPGSLFKPQTEAIEAIIYRQIVAYARLPVFYTDFGVPDSVDGRFDMVALIATLVFRRLSGLKPEGPKLAQKTFDLMFADMAHNLREIGLGDDGVTRQIQGMAQGFYGRAKAYDSALAQTDDQALVEALGRNLFRGHPPDSTILFNLAKYLREFVVRLDAQPDLALIQGQLRLVEAEAQ